MRVVADTNVVVSGLLWHGPSRRILDLARAKTLELSTSAELISELRDVLERPGDHHLLDLGQFRDCIVLTARKFLDELGVED